MHCPFGFKLRESSTTPEFECDIHGVWLPADRTADVFCVPIECGELPRFENAMVSSGNFFTEVHRRGELTQMLHFAKQPMGERGEGVEEAILV